MMMYNGELMEEAEWLDEEYESMFPDKPLPRTEIGSPLAVVDLKRARIFRAYIERLKNERT